MPDDPVSQACVVGSVQRGGRHGGSIAAPCIRQRPRPSRSVFCPDSGKNLAFRRVETAGWGRGRGADQPDRRLDRAVGRARRPGWWPTSSGGISEPVEAYVRRRHAYLQMYGKRNERDLRPDRSGTGRAAGGRPRPVGAAAAPDRVRLRPRATKGDQQRMCGIVGYIGGQNAVPILMEGLFRLEYRGYDSAGIAIVSPQGHAVFRRVGRVRELEASLPRRLTGKVGIGHTRWATHGPVTQANAHPQVSEDGRISVVHNGIIDNAMELREELQAKGETFSSETDTEVVAHLIARSGASSARGRGTRRARPDHRDLRLRGHRRAAPGPDRRRQERLAADPRRRRPRDVHRERPVRAGQAHHLGRPPGRRRAGDGDRRRDSAPSAGRKRIRPRRRSASILRPTTSTWPATSISCARRYSSSPRRRSGCCAAGWTSGSAQRGWTGSTSARVTCGASAGSRSSAAARRTTSARSGLS